MDRDPINFTSRRLQRNREFKVVKTAKMAPLPESVEQFARLLGLVEEQKRDVLARPLVYLEDAAREIGRLQRVLDQARDALRQGGPARYVEPSDTPMLEQIETVRVTKQEYARLMGCAHIVRKHFDTPR